MNAKTNHKHQLNCLPELWIECFRVSVLFLRDFKNGYSKTSSSQAFLNHSANPQFHNLVILHGYTKILNAVFEAADPDRYMAAKKQVKLWKGLVPGTRITDESDLLYDIFDKFYRQLVGPTFQHLLAEKAFSQWPAENKKECLKTFSTYGRSLSHESWQTNQAIENIIANHPQLRTHGRRIDYLLIEIVDEVYPNWFVIYNIRNPSGRYAFISKMFKEHPNTILDKIDEYLTNNGVKKMVIANTAEEKTQAQQPQPVEAETTKKTPEVSSPKPTTVRDIVKLRRLADTSHVIAVMLESVREIEERRYTQGGVNGAHFVPNRSAPDQGMVPNWSRPNGQGTLFTEGGMFRANALNGQPNTVKLTEEQLARADELMLQLVDTLFPTI